MKKIAAIVSYCTNDRHFLGACLSELRGFCDPIIVSHGDRFFDSEPEDLDLIEQQRWSYSFAKFVRFHVDPDLSVTSRRRAGTTWHWHNVARIAGLLELGASAEHVLLLDADEILDGRRFADFLNLSNFENFDAIRFETYWYFKSSRYQAVEREVAGALFRRQRLSVDNLMLPYERNDLFEKMEGKKADHVVGRDGLPMVHHYSWVRTHEDMLRKVKCWGHRADKDWPSLIEESFREDGLPRTDFVHGYHYVEVEPFASVENNDEAARAIVEEPDVSVSVIIPVFNNLKYTRQCITSLFTVKESVNFEVIVVDNGSNDGTADYLSQLPPPVRVICPGENLGFARGCNAGASAARGRYLCFLNNDTIALPGWLTEMVKCIEADDSIGVVGNLQIFPGSEKVQQAGIVCGPNKIVRSIYNNELSPDHPAVNKPREFQFVAGSCLLIRRELFRELGGFDESYVNSCEDVDLCMKVRQTGKRVFYCPQSRIYHYESKTVTGHAKDSENYRRFVARWGDKVRQDDLDYLREDGFLPGETGKSQHTDQDLRVGILSTYNQVCGLAGYARQLVDALRGQGIHPTILAEQTSDILSEDEENVVRCWKRDQANGSELLAEIAARKIEVLHINYGGMFALDGWFIRMMAALRETGVRVVTTFHTTESHAEEFGRLCRLSDHVFVHHSQNILELAAAGAPVDRIEQIPLGMPAVDRRDVFESKLELGWDPKRKIVSTFGFIEPHKGILELIEAMAEVHKNTGAHLHVLGTPHPFNPDSRAYLETCRSRAGQLGLQDVVVFSETYLPDDEITRRLRASDVIVMNYTSRRYESSAATAIALASGRPVVSSSVPPFDLPLALTFKVTPVFHLAQAIYDVLTNPFIGRALLNNVYEYEKIARWDVVAKRMADVYRRVAAEPLREDVDLLKYYGTHPDEIYAEPLQRERVHWLKGKAEGRILEIGPATGYVSEFVGAAAAVDINRGRLAVCKALRPGTRFLYGDVVSGLPFGDREFDQVHAPEILEHVDFDQAIVALRECMRVGKRVLLTLPNADKPDYDPNLVHVIEHRWLVCRQTLNQLLRECGCTDYEVDVSQGLDFYLLDIRTETTAPRASVSPRAAALAGIEICPGRPLRVAVDVSPLENPASRELNPNYPEQELFREIAVCRPLWRITAYGLDAEPKNCAVSRFVESIGGRYAHWNQLTDALPDVLYLPDPMTGTAQEVLQAAGQLDVLIACTFSDLTPLVKSDEYLSSDPGFKSWYLSRLAQLQRRCDLFFCTSQTTAQDLQVRLRIALARLRIVSLDTAGHSLEQANAGHEFPKQSTWRRAAETTAMYLSEAAERRKRVLAKRAVARTASEPVPA